MNARKKRRKKGGKAPAPSSRRARRRRWQIRYETMHHPLRTAPPHQLHRINDDERGQAPVHRRSMVMTPPSGGVRDLIGVLLQLHHVVIPLQTGGHSFHRRPARLMLRPRRRDRREIRRLGTPTRRRIRTRPPMRPPATITPRKPRKIIRDVFPLSRRRWRRRRRSGVSRCRCPP